MNTRIEIELKYAPGKISLNFGRFVGEKQNKADIVAKKMKKEIMYLSQTEML